MPTTRLLAASDVMVSSGFPTKNYAGVAYMQVNATPNDRVGYVFFNQPFPLGVTVLSATLRLYQRGAATGGSRTLTVRRAASAWAESTLVNGGRPAATGASATRVLGNSAVDGREWAFDVTAAMQEVSDDETGAWYGFRIDSGNATAMNLYSRESGGAFVPVLEVEWSDAPSAPSRLSPSAGRAISVARPTLRFDFTDVSGDTAMGGFEVEVNDSASFASPDFSSGEVDSGIPQWTLDGDLTVSTTYYWRVRVKDGAGVWSDWSDTATFARTAKPALTITAPAVAPGDVVYTPTPTFAWTVTGQMAFQLFLVDPADSSVVLWTSDKQTSAVSSYSVPQSDSLLLAPGESYTLVVRVWDSVARESIPEEPVYVEASRTFSFGTEGSTTGVSSLTATEVDGLPFVLLEWTRASAPDEFVIVVAGRTFAIPEAADISTGGTGYAFEVRGLPPGVATSVSVGAKVGASTSNLSTVSTTVTASGWWVYSLTPDGPVVAIKVRDGGPARPVSEEPSENTAIFRSTGSTRPVMISSVVRPPEGDGAGWLDDVDRDTWVELTSPRVSTIGMTIVDKVKQVQVFNVVTGYADELWPDTLPVDFDYIEVG